jgi:phospholipid transport system substrate-binding protein
MKFARKIAFNLLIALIALGFGQASAALDDHTARPQSPASFIQHLGDRAVELFASGASDDERVEAIKEIVRDNVDLDRIGRFVIGPYLGRMMPAQQARYAAMYREYVLDAMARRFSSIRFLAFRITKSQALSDGDILVRTLIEQAGYPNRIREPVSEPPPLNVAWRVEEEGGRYRISDVVVEDVSLALTQRQEFALLIERKGLNDFLDTLEAKVAELRE